MATTNTPQVQATGTSYLVARASLGDWHYGGDIGFGGFDTSPNLDDAWYGVKPQGTWDYEETNYLTGETGPRIVPRTGRFGPPKMDDLNSVRTWNDGQLASLFSFGLCNVLRTGAIGMAMVNNFMAPPNQQQKVFKHHYLNGAGPDDDPVFLGRFAYDHATVKAARDRIVGAIWNKCSSASVRSNINNVTATLQDFLNAANGGQAPLIDFESSWKELLAVDYTRDILNVPGGIIDAIRRTLNTDPWAYNPDVVLKAIIGGSHGTQAAIKNMQYRKENSGLIRKMRFDLYISIYDTFGLGGDDNYQIVLCAFYVLQHERGYRPFRQWIRLCFRDIHLEW